MDDQEFRSTTATIDVDRKDLIVTKRLHTDAWLLSRCPGSSMEDKYKFLQDRYVLYKEYFGDQMVETEFELHDDGTDKQIILRQPLIIGKRLTEVVDADINEVVHEGWVRLVNIRQDLAKDPRYEKFPEFFKGLLYTEISEDSNNIILTPDSRFVMIDW